MWRFQFNRSFEFDLEPVVVNGKSYAVDAVLTDGRTASASLKGNRIIIRIPKFARNAEAERLFFNLKGRIAKSLERHPERFEKYQLAFSHGQVLSINGKSFPIVVENTFAGMASARVYDDKIIVRIPTVMEGLGKDSLTTKLVTKALQRTFTPLMESRVNEWRRFYPDTWVTRVTLRNTSSRWGSYSKASGNISLSVRLLFAPQEILDYVIVHELAHGKHHNHGIRFWSLVEKILPDYKTRRRWLRKHGDSLGKPVPTDVNA